MGFVGEGVEIRRRPLLKDNVIRIEIGTERKRHQLRGVL